MEYVPVEIKDGRLQWGREGLRPYWVDTRQIPREHHELAGHWFVARGGSTSTWKPTAEAVEKSRDWLLRQDLRKLGFASYLEDWQACRVGDTKGRDCRRWEHKKTGGLRNAGKNLKQWLKNVWSIAPEKWWYHDTLKADQWYGYAAGIAGAPFTGGASLSLIELQRQYNEGKKYQAELDKSGSQRMQELREQHAAALRKARALEKSRAVDRVAHYEKEIRSKEFREMVAAGEARRREKHARFAAQRMAVTAKAQEIKRRERQPEVAAAGSSWMPLAIAGGLLALVAARR